MDFGFYLVLPCCCAAVLPCCRAAVLPCCRAAVLPCCRGSYPKVQLLFTSIQYTTIYIVTAHLGTFPGRTDSDSAVLSFFNAAMLPCCHAAMLPCCRAALLHARASFYSDISLGHPWVFTIQKLKLGHFKK